MNKNHCEELDNLFNWNKLYPVSIKDIKWALTTAFDIRKGEWNKVWSGDWDKKLPIAEDFVQTSVTKMINENLPFEETELYKYSIKKILAGEYRWGCKTVEEFKTRGEHILKIFNNIKKYGFKTQKELDSIKEYSFKVNNICIDEPGVAIDKDGRYLYHNGNHRLAILRVLDIKTVKIKVNARHKDWVEFLQYVKNISKDIWGEARIYQPVNHIDFNDYECEWSNYRFNIIKENLDKNNKTLLDIGALWGYFASSFEKEGLECTAVENNNSFVYIMDKLKIANDQNFKIFNGNIFSLDNFNHDIVLALNIFHHFLKSEQSFNNLTKFLNNLNMKTMYFQVHRPEEKQMIGAYRNFQSEEFLKYIINNSCLTHYKEIGEELGRKIYKLWKE